MKSKRPFLAFGFVILAVTLYGLLRPKPAPTEFERGYGLRLIKEERFFDGVSWVVSRFYASPEDFDSLLKRVDREDGRFVYGQTWNSRSWRFGEGTVVVRDTTEDRPSQDLPKGSKSALTTIEYPKPNLLQRIALTLGIRQ